MPPVTIPVGKGCITIKGGISREAARGRYVVLRSSARSGPCNDQLCQIIRGVKVSIEVPEEDEDNLSIFAGEGIFVAVDSGIVRSIDKGRQQVTVGMGITGKLYIKGLNYSD